MKCFLSCSFDPGDEKVVNWFKAFLGAFPDTEIIIEEITSSPGSIPDRIRQSIMEADFFCAIVTSKNGAASFWILSEIAIAFAHRKEIAAFVEFNVPDSAIPILPNIIGFQRFKRDSLGYLAPEYIEYIHNIQKIVSENKGFDQDKSLRELRSLFKKQEKLIKEFEYLKLTTTPPVFDV